MFIILCNFNQFNIFYTGRFPGKFVIIRIFEIPPHLACFATLPRETLMSAKQAINDKLQDSVVPYLRCGGVVNNQIKQGLLLSLWVNFLIGEYLTKLQAKRDCLVQFLRLSAVFCPGMQSARDNHVLACNFAKYSPI